MQYCNFMKIFCFLSILGCSVFLHSCRSELSEGSLSGEAGELTFTASDFKYAPSSRTSLTVSNDGVKFSWSTNDTVGIFPDKGTQVSFSMEAGAGTKTASFDGGGWSLKPASTYAAYYPLRGEFYLDKCAIPLDYTGQTQTGNASTAHLSAYDYMGAVARTPDNGNVIFDFKHIGALVQLNIPLTEVCELTTVFLRMVDASFIAKASLDLSSPSLTVTSLEQTHDYKICLKDMSFTKPNQTATVYFFLSPVDLSGKNIEVTVSRDGNLPSLQYAFTGQKFESGLAYSVSLSPIADNAPAEVEAVDLGLPSGVKWASCNVGATKAEERAGFYAWGEIEERKGPFTVDDYLYYKYVSGDTNAEQNWINIGSEISGTQYDVAHVTWGGSWRMPTKDEAQELVDNCTWTEISYNGTWGVKFTGPNGNSIFLPSAGEYIGNNPPTFLAHGCYWTGTLNSTIQFASTLKSSKNPYITGNFRAYGGSVRPVTY